LTVERFEHRRDELANLQYEMTELGRELREQMQTLRADIRRDLAECSTDSMKWAMLFWVAQAVAVAGIVSAWYCYIVNPALPSMLKRAAGPIYTLLDQKYYFDRFNDWFFAGGARAMGHFLSTVGDRSIIDGFFVNGTARLIGWTASLVRHVQSGYVYHYAFTMILGVFALLTWYTR